MAAFTYFQPFNHDGATTSWLGAIFNDASRYTVQSSSATAMTVVATASSGFAGYSVVLTGTFNFQNGALFSSSVESADLLGPGGALIGSAVIGGRSLDLLKQAGQSHLTGSSGGDTLTGGNEGFAFIRGGAGNDLLRTGNNYFGPNVYGGPGADTMIGQGGIDVFFTGDGADQIDGGGNDDEVYFDEATGRVEIWLDQPAAPGQIRIDNVESIFAPNHGLIVHGGARDDWVMGANGVDSMMGGGGADDMLGGMGDDLLMGDDGNDNLHGEGGADTVWGGAGDDGMSGADGRDFLRGEDGDDQLWGGADFDDMHGNKGRDTLHGQDGDDWVVGGQGSDLLYADAGIDVVYGNMGDDTLYGGTDRDILRGGQDNDTMEGGDGDDWLSGDRGNDTMSGGAGADTFSLIPEAGTDRVLDFSSAQGDRVAFEYPGMTYALSFEGGDTVITLTGGHRMVLVGVSQAALGDWLAG